MGASWYVAALGKYFQALRRACGLLLVWSAVASPAFAFQRIPEIDPGAMTSALTLLVGGVLLLTDRRRK
jgi:hypothetical protein